MFFKCAHHAPADQALGGTVAGNGSKTLTVDIHCHVMSKRANEFMADVIGEPNMDFANFGSQATRDANAQQFKEISPKLTDVQVRLADMDKMGIDIQAISPSPAHYYYAAEPERGRDAARMVNDDLAEIVGNHPDRFVAMGTVPLQNTEMAIAEMERCVREMDMRGIEVSTNVNGAELADKRLDPFWARAEELGIVIFLHPAGFSDRDRFFDHHLNNVIGNPLDTTTALSHLIFEGTLERYPGLKICAAHGGGFIGAYSARWDHAYHARADCRQHISSPPTSFLKNLYFDTMVFEPDQLKYLIDKWGADHIVLGTDYPFDMGYYEPLSLIESVNGISDDDKAALGGLNAAKLLNIPV